MNLIAVVDKNWGLSCSGKLLFDLPLDLARFKEHTTNKVVVMGSKTFDSLPIKPLPNRTNIVLTTQKGKICGGAITVNSLAALFDQLKKYDSADVYVIGGGSVYGQLIDFCDTAYITKVFAAKKPDTFLTNLDAAKNWKLTDQQNYVDNGYKCGFFVYKQDKKI